MSKDRKPINEGYQPQTIKKGYQPATPVHVPTGDPKPQGGYQPTGTGDNPGNVPKPTPPGDE